VIDVASDSSSDARLSTRRPTLILYGRSNCHLCDVAKEIIEAVRTRVDFDVIERDVDDDPDWAEAYGDQVPVAFLRERKVFKYRVDPAALERLIRGALSD